MFSYYDALVFMTLYNFVLTYGLSNLAVYDCWLFLFKELLLDAPAVNI